MGLNIPFIHGEESPSRLLLGKAAVAGAHSMLLYAMSMTPGAPIIKEFKPATMIGWKDVARGIIKKGGKTYPLYDCAPEKPYSLEKGTAFICDTIEEQGYPTGKDMEGTYIDTGENGYFPPKEFEVITAPGLMEFITPEDIAHQAVMNITGTNTSCDVISAIDGAVMKPTYRAGILRRDAIEKAKRLDGSGITYGFLGPRVSKFIAECTLIQYHYKNINDVLDASPEHITSSWESLVLTDGAIRINLISIGLPILLPDGERILFAKRLIKDKVWEERPWPITQKNIDYFADLGWIDLRVSNVIQWQIRIRNAYKEGDHTQPLDVGKVVSWVLINECEGGRLGACT